MAYPATLLQRVSRFCTNGAAAPRAWQAVLVSLVLAVSYLALTPAPLEGSYSGLDKVGHVMAFMALSFAGYLAFPAARGTRTALLCGLFAYGGLIELLQLFVPGRSSEWGDLIADGLGIALGAGLAALFVRFGSEAGTPAQQATQPRMP